MGGRARPGAGRGMSLIDTIGLIGPISLMCVWNCVSGRCVCRAARPLRPCCTAMSIYFRRGIDFAWDRAQFRATPAIPAGAITGDLTMTMQDQTNSSKKVRAKVAEHEFIDAAGEPVDDGESAQGYRYTLLASGDSFDWYWAQANDDEKRMLAIFGAKTLATNETSQARNNPKGSGSAAEQMEALRERFTMLRSGQWVDRSREGSVVKIDKDALAEAICQVLVAKGKATEADIAGGVKAQKRQLLEDDATYLRKSRQVPEVAIAYAAIVGRQVATVEDL